MAEVDLVNRDPNNMNEYIQVSFDDVLAEPEGAHSMDCVWSNSHKCFNCGMKCYYKIATLLCGLCYALHWGCMFGAVAFEAIWFWTPVLRLLTIALFPVRKVMAIFLNCKLLYDFQLKLGSSVSCTHIRIFLVFKILH